MPLIDLGSLNKYPIGIPMRFEYTSTTVTSWERTATNYGLYVLRRNESEVRVFADICTHRGCRVNWHSDQQNYISRCQNDNFDILGNVVSGPPPRPIDEYVTQIKNRNLLAIPPPFKRHI